MKRYRSTWLLFIILMLYTYPFIQNSLCQELLVVKEGGKEVIISGYTRADTTVTVSAEVSGKILRLNYNEGQPVDKKPLVEIEPTFIDFEIKSTRQMLNQLDIRIKSIQSKINYLSKEFQRYDALYKKDTIAESKRDNAAQELEQARHELNSAQVERTSKKITLDELTERRTRYTINIPKGYVITEKLVEPGAFVQIGTQLAKVSDYSTMVVPLFVSNEELKAFKTLTKTFDVTVEGKGAIARINWINPLFDEKNRKLNMELAIVNYDGEKRGGLKVSVRLKLNIDGVLIPEAALKKGYENPTVTIKEGAQTVHVVIIDKINGDFVVGADNRLKPGTVLLGNQ
ncbi:MAG: HlyD family efflux transporter periplasmic adaptor subunit [Candidatus Magnetoovum sp. WYHC-5]|nr:HlyD family efflux transporter periplasmic adaptor subunit [Candidatus Magnetoovum sp. WYHC-5]